MASDLSLLQLLAKQLNDLKKAFKTLSKQPGPKGDRGDDGRTPTPEELQALIAPLIPAPVRGENGHTPTASELQALIEPLIPAPIRAEDGKTGPRGPMPDHRWKGKSLQFEKPSGEWGELVDLEGPKGPRGPGGGGGVVSGGPDLDGLPSASDDVPSGFLVRQDGQWVVASLVQMQAWLGTVVEPPEEVEVTVDGEAVTVDGEAVTVTE